MYDSGSREFFLRRNEAIVNKLQDLLEIIGFKNRDYQVNAGNQEDIAGEYRGINPVELVSSNPRSVEDLEIIFHSDSFSLIQQVNTTLIAHEIPTFDPDMMLIDEDVAPFVSIKLELNGQKIESVEEKLDKAIRSRGQKKIGEVVSKVPDDAEAGQILLDALHDRPGVIAEFINKATGPNGPDQNPPHPGRQ